MKADRRQFVLACAGFAVAPMVHAQQPSFRLWFPPESLDLSKPFGFAVVASAACRCEVDFVDEEKRSLMVAPGGAAKWDLEPKRAQAKMIERAPETSLETGAAGVMLEVRPYTEKRPHFAGVVQTGAHSVQLTQMKPDLAAFSGNNANDKERLKESAESLPFVRDPAPRPDEGYFTVDLRAESKLHLKIWPGDNRRRIPIYEHVFRNLPAGKNPVPWSLRTNSGSIVDAGEYLATLVATPKMTGRSDTLYFASFQVV
jgi:hypothetical protein